MLPVLEAAGIPATRLSVIIGAVGSEIHYVLPRKRRPSLTGGGGGTTPMSPRKQYTYHTDSSGRAYRLVPDQTFARHLNWRWDRAAITRCLAGVPGLMMQCSDPDNEQRPFKISYDVNPDVFPPLKDVHKRLRMRGLRAKLVYSHEQKLDVLPVRATKGLAVTYVAGRVRLPLRRIMVAGDSGNDTDMLKGGSPATVVANHGAELEVLRGYPDVYFSQASHAHGVLEGLQYFGVVSE